MRALITWLLFTATAQADENQKRVQTAFAAQLCFLKEAQADALKRARILVASLVKNPLAADYVEALREEQQRWARFEELLDGVKAAMVSAKVGTLPCSGKLLKRLIYCMSSWGGGLSYDGACDTDPDIALYKDVDGVPPLKLKDE